MSLHAYEHDEADPGAIARWEPTPRQAAFLSSPAYEALYGGTVGGGKTESIVLGALRWIGHPKYRALIMRRTFQELEDDIIPLSHDYFPWAGGKYNEAKKRWRFPHPEDLGPDGAIIRNHDRPRGSTIQFGHCQHEKDVVDYHGIEIQYLGFDELTTFTERIYRYLLHRCRTSFNIPIRVRASAVPGGVGHEWVLKRWAPWLENADMLRRLKLRSAVSDEVLRYRNTERGEVYDPKGKLSRVFFRARAEDNPHLTANDPDYMQRMLGMDQLSVERLVKGDWQARGGAGKYFSRAMFTITDAIPVNVRRVRYWDLAGTDGAGDWTVGVLLGRYPNGRFVVIDVIRQQIEPGEVEELIKTTAEVDGKSVSVWVPQDPGQAGKAQAAAFIRLLARYDVHALRETGSKEVRARPVSAQARARNIEVVRAWWNDEFFRVLEAFPTAGVPDDDVDALSGAMSAILDTPLTTAERWAGGRH